MARGLGVALLCGVLGCGRGASGPGPLAGAPSWVARGSGAFSTPAGRQMVGVGGAELDDGPGLARVVATARARAELAPLIDAWVADLLAAHGERRERAGASSALTELAHGLAEESDAWSDGAGRLYARVVLDVDAFRAALAAADRPASAIIASVLPVLDAAFAARVREAPRAPALPPAGHATTVEPEALAGARRRPPALASEPCLLGLTLAPAAEDDSSCVIDDRVARSPGVLRYACAGGEAEALFGDARFLGAVTDGVVSLGLESSFRFTDGCLWRSEQRIDGALGAGRLRFRYAEAPAPGQQECEDACAIERDLRVSD